MRPSTLALPLLGLCLLVAAGAQAATISADGTICTLADAITAANDNSATGGCPAGDAGADIIVLDADVTLTAVDPSSSLVSGVGSGLPDVEEALTITAGLGSVIQRDPSFTCDIATSDPVFRFLYLLDGVSLTLENLSFEGGCFVASINAYGAGLYAEIQSVLTLDGVTVRDLTVISPSNRINGGVLYSQGDLVAVTDSRFEAIDVTSSDLIGGVIRFSPDTTGAPMIVERTVFSDIHISSASLMGGAIRNSSGQFTASDVTFEDLVLEAGTILRGGAMYLTGNASAEVAGTSIRRLEIVYASQIQGGALSVDNTGLALRAVEISDLDLTTSGSCEGGGIDTAEVGPYEGLIVENVTCTSGGTGSGGGAYFRANDTIVRDCVFRGNQLLAGAAAVGGGVRASELAVLERCAFVDNYAGQATALTTGDASGGGLYAVQADVLRNVTFSGNLAEGGSGVAAGADGGSAYGGGLFLGNSPGTSFVSSITATANQAIAGAAADGFADGEALGGGLFLQAAHTASLAGSIFVGNTSTAADGTITAEDCLADGTFTSLGYNLVETPDSTCDLSAFGDLTGIDPGLYPVDDYGCDVALLDGSCVPTAAIDQTSWAVDWGSCAEAFVTVDARDLARRQDIVGVSNLADACDVGAFEARDSDGDGVTDVPDLCPDDADPDQADSDGDQVGDACDACEGDDATGDSDGDLVCDDTDICAGFDDAADADADDVPDGCDICLGDDATGDSDTDLVCDDQDICPGFDDGADTDSDSVPDGCDLCAGSDDGVDADGDSVPDGCDVCAGFDDGIDTDGDSVPDGCDVCAGFDDGIDTDSDSVPDGCDVCAGFDDGADFDGDGIPDGCDLCTGDNDSGDSDGDGICDEADARVGDRVWLDDGDGVQAGGEPGVAGVTVRLYDVLGGLLDTTSTDADGFYTFWPGPGDYYLEFVLPADMAFAARDQGNDDTADSDVFPFSGTTSPFTLATGQADTTRDAGVEPAVIGDLVWLDGNVDGRQQPGEAGLAGVTVRLLDDADQEVATTTTGADGLYGFVGIPSGTYRVEVVPPADAVFSIPNVGSDDLIDSDVDPSTGRTELFDYAAASASRGWDAGLRLLPFFADGFESGDVSAWSSSVP